MGYTNIQMGVHDQKMHMTIEQFGNVPINEIVRTGRLVGDNNSGDDFDFILMEDGNFFELEVDMGQTIPTEASKLWDVPPPSYIRGVSTTTGAYITFDDNTKPPDFSDNTAPPSFDATSGT